MMQILFILLQENHRLHGQRRVIIIRVEMEMEELLEGLLEVDDDRGLVIQEELKDLDKRQPALLLNNPLIRLIMVKVTAKHTPEFPTFLMYTRMEGVSDCSILQS